MKRIILLLFISLLCFTSCRKNKKTSQPECPAQETPAPVKYPVYFPLQTGNYWVYERFRIDENGNAQSENKFDSTYVEKDTLIHGRTFYKIRRYDFTFGRKEYWIIRDSLHYLIYPSGEILFSSENFSTVFYGYYILNGPPTNDTVANITTQMGDKDLDVTVPAGTYRTSAMKYKYRMYPGYALPELSVRYRNNRFTKDIGLVSETEQFFSSIPWYYERRLVRYKVN